ASTALACPVALSSPSIICGRTAPAPFTASRLRIIRTLCTRTARQKMTVMMLMNVAKPMLSVLADVANQAGRDILIPLPQLRATELDPTALDIERLVRVFMQRERLSDLQ